MSFNIISIGVKWVYTIFFGCKNFNIISKRDKIGIYNFFVGCMIFNIISIMVRMIYTIFWGVQEEKKKECA